MYDTNEHVVSKDGKTKTQTIRSTDGNGNERVLIFIYDMSGLGS